MNHHRFMEALTIVQLGFGAFASACHSPQPANETASRPETNQLGRAAEVVPGLLGRFQRRQMDEFKQCYATNATSEQYGYGKPTVSGPDAIAASSQNFKKLAPDGHGEAQLILVNGSHIARVYLLSGTNSGPNDNHPMAKRCLRQTRNSDIFSDIRLKNSDPAANKVDKELGIMDGVTFANQLGMSPEALGRPLMTKGAAMPTIVIAKNDDTEMKNVAVEQSEFAAWNMHDSAQADMYMADGLHSPR